MHIYIGTYLYGTKTDPDWDGTVTEQTSIHRALLTQKVLFL